MVQFNHDDLISVLKENTEKNIRPYYKNLRGDDIRTKKAGSLVTLADEASEAFLESALMRLLPNSFVLGEEAFEKDPRILSRFDSDKPVWVIDPIDGTYNFAHGRSKWGVLLALVYKEDIIFGTLYDVLNERFVFSYRGEGAYDLSPNANNEEVRLEPGARTLDDYLGHVGGAQSWHFKVLSDLCGGVTNIRCCLHDFLAFLDGDIDFVLHKGITPWDKCAATLVIAEAGGFLGTGRKGAALRPAMIGAKYNLATYDQKTFDILTERFYGPLYDKKAVKKA